MKPLLGEAFKNEPLAISQLTRMLIAECGTITLVACLDKVTSQKEFNLWLEILPVSEILNGSVETAMRGELAALIQHAEHPEHLIRPDPQNASLTTRWGMVLVGPLLTYKSLPSLEKTWRLTECCLKPYPESRIQAKIINPPTLCHDTDSYDTVELLIPAVRRMLDRQVFTQSILAVTRAGIEFELHHLRNGKYPKTTSIVDPCTLKPLLYESTKGYIRSQGPPEGILSLEVEVLTWKLRNP